MKNKLKKLREKRNTLMDEMDGLLAACEDGDETRAFTEDEQKRFGEIENEIRALDEQITAIETRDALEQDTPADDTDPATVEQRTIDEQNFLSFCRGETRALNVADNSNGRIRSIIKCRTAKAAGRQL